MSTSQNRFGSFPTGTASKRLVGHAWHVGGDESEFCPPEACVEKVLIIWLQVCDVTPSTLLPLLDTLSPLLPLNQQKVALDDVNTIVEKSLYSFVYPSRRDWRRAS